MEGGPEVALTILLILTIYLHYLLARVRMVFKYSSREITSESKAFFKAPIASSIAITLLWNLIRRVERGLDG